MGETNNSEGRAEEIDAELVSQVSGENVYELSSALRGVAPQEIAPGDGNMKASRHIQVNPQTGELTEIFGDAQKPDITTIDVVIEGNWPQIVKAVGEGETPPKEDYRIMTFERTQGLSPQVLEVLKKTKEKYNADMDRYGS